MTVLQRQEPTTPDPRGRKHVATTVATAQQLYADGEGWGAKRITSFLNERGIEVHENTVRQWVRPELAEKRREDQRRVAAARRGGDLNAGRRTPILDRMVALRSAGVSYRCIAVVIQMDMGVTMNGDAVRYHVRLRREPVLPARRSA